MQGIDSRVEEGQGGTVNSTTICAYCGSENGPEEHRCVQCARRLPAGSVSTGPVLAGQGGEIMLERTLGLKRGASPTFANQTNPKTENRRPTPIGQNMFDSSAARQPQMFEVPVRAEPPVAKQAPPPAQGVLFSALEVRSGEQFRSKVVELNDFREPRARARRRPSGRALPPSDVGAQQTLFSEIGDMAPLAMAAPVADSGLPSAALVAPVVQRVTATVLDIVMVCLAESLLLFALYMSPAAGFVTTKTLPVLAVFGLVLAVGYKLLFALAETDSPGTRWTHLKVLNFDGAPPTRNERLVRLAGGLMAVAASGLGLIWALVDEETLSWHDHISKTFASPDFGPITRHRAR